MNFVVLKILIFTGLICHAPSIMMGVFVVLIGGSVHFHWTQPVSAMDSRAINISMLFFGCDKLSCICVRIRSTDSFVKGNLGNKLYLCCWGG